MEKENARRQDGYSLDQVAQRLKADPKYRTPARFVRTNAVGTTRMIEDFKAVVRHGLEGLVIPKVDTVEQVRIVEDELGRDEVAQQHAGRFGEIADRHRKPRRAVQRLCAGHVVGPHHRAHVRRRGFHPRDESPTAPRRRGRRSDLRAFAHRDPAAAAHIQAVDGVWSI